MSISQTARTMRERGDTIVEVLIAIAIISLVLGGAYATTNRSLRATRSAQERAVALKLSESQIEQLKGIIAANPNLVFGGSAPSPFCIFSGGVVATSTGNCALSTAGVPTTAEPKFNIAISRPASDSTFVIQNTWIDVGGNQNAELKLTYRVYQ